MADDKDALELAREITADPDNEWRNPRSWLLSRALLSAPATPSEGLVKLADEMARTIEANIARGYPAHGSGYVYTVDLAKHAVMHDAARAYRKTTPSTSAVPEHVLLTMAAAEHLKWVLPMAKGYAALHPVGSNQEIVNNAEEFLVSLGKEGANDGR